MTYTVHLMDSPVEERVSCVYVLSSFHPIAL
jgi:hypothetical protein